MIYLDNSATTKPCKEAVEAITLAMTENWGNPSALYNFGIDTAHMMRDARHKVAAALGAEPDRVFFTSGGTEADNWAIHGTIKRFGKRGKHIITTAIEHHAILHPMKELESQGFVVTYLKPDEMGRITIDALKAALRKDTILVSIMMVNNEVGSVMPIAQMAKLTHKICPNAVFHTDAVQGFLKVPFQAKTLGADLISISSHKVHGPKGCGALYIAPRLKSFPALLIGGGDVALFVGLQVGDLEALGLQILHAVQDGVVLNGGGNDVLAALAVALDGGVDGPVVGLSTAGGEEHPVGFCAQNGGDLAAGVPEGMGGVDAEAIQSAGIAPALHHGGGHGLDGFLTGLGGCGIV